MKSEKYFEDTVLSFIIGHRSCHLENTGLCTQVDSQSGLVWLWEDKPNPQRARSVPPPGVSPSGDLPSSLLLSELPQSEPSSSSSARRPLRPDAWHALRAEGRPPLHFLPTPRCLSIKITGALPRGIWWQVPWSCAALFLSSTVLRQFAIIHLCEPLFTNYLSTCVHKDKNCLWITHRWQPIL